MLERGEISPELETLEALAKVMEVKPTQVRGSMLVRTSPWHCPGTARGGAARCLLRPRHLWGCLPRSEAVKA